ncbi:acyltransferase 3 [Intrasporangium calvum DSM 43043]|uniref:Acyltransferase 3 n=2 Tax=Intrasporangium calvum TaxID=53358 RepID=E6S8I8_INTC7|nr:acyltransferase family protein [Intrasporangium calvum]ADU49150.1 acyltransferase 3 [Intrasporangium calvum DSM 43043]
MAGLRQPSARRPDIQGMRALAVLMVVLFHAGAPLPGGFVGVDVFFVISGYVITSMLSRELAASGRIRLGRFYLRRFKRLTPALAVVVAFTLLASTLLLSPMGGQQSAAKTALGAMLLAANVVIARESGDYFGAPAEANPLLHTWSLSVEEQFYFVFPLLLAGTWAFARRRNGVPGPIAAIGLVAGLSFALAVAGSAGLRHSNPYVDAVLSALTGFYSPLTRVWEFAVGALLALGLLRYKRLSSGSAGMSGVAGIGLLAASVWLIGAATPFPGVWTLLPVIGTGLLLVAGTRGANGVSRLLARGPLVKIGDWSYSLYLWHWPFIVLAKVAWPTIPAAVPLAAIASFVPAYVSYRWVEQPIRQMEIRSGRRLVRVVGLAFLPPLALAGLLHVSATNGFWLDPVRSYQAQVTPLHAAAVAGCHASGPLDGQAVRDCVWNPSAPGAPVYLLGDSQAEHWSEGVIGAGEALDHPVIIKTGGNCPLVRVALDRLDAVADVNAACREYVQATVDFLRTATPGLVILSSADSYWTNERVSVALDTGSLSTETGAKLETLTVALRETVETVKEAGHQVVLVQARPSFASGAGADPAECSLVAFWSETGCRSQMAVEEALANQGQVRRVVDRVATDTGSTVLDPWQVLCGDGVCDTQHGALVRYRDGSHVSVRQSEAMAPVFAAAILKQGI